MKVNLKDKMFIILYVIIILVILIVTSILIYNSSKNKAKTNSDINNKEVENISSEESLIIDEATEDIVSNVEKNDEEPIKEEEKDLDKTISVEDPGEKVQNTSSNPGPTATEIKPSQSTTNNNKNNPVSSGETTPPYNPTTDKKPSEEIKPSEPQTEQPSQTEEPSEENTNNNTNNTQEQPPITQNVERFERNDYYIGLLTSAVHKYAKENDLCVEYGYTVTTNKNVMNYTTQFTYSEENIKGIVLNGGTKYQVYAQDYYLNDNYLYTECYLASVP